MEKVKLPRKVAEQIEWQRNSVSPTNYDIIKCAIAGTTGFEIKEFAEDNFDELLQALVNGYEVEETPEDKVKEAFTYAIEQIEQLGDHPQAEHWKGMKAGIIVAVRTLNIKIEGIN